MDPSIKHQARKRFGQNFLKDASVIDAIVRAILPAMDDNMLEIGPGLGALTKPLLKNLNHLNAIEIDRDLQATLRQMPEAQNKLTVIGADALNVDLKPMGAALRVVGNLPYNISTPLILHLLSFGSQIKDMHFMLQKEVVERLAAQPHSKDYGRLSVMVQADCEVDNLFGVPPTAFSPAPKVDSAIVRLRPYTTNPYPQIDKNVLSKVVQRAFGMRRKTLANNFKPILSQADISALGINPMSRPEDLSVAEYISLAQFFISSDRINQLIPGDPRVSTP